MTNKIVLRDIEQFLADFVPTYSPIMPLFMRNAQSYAAEAGKVTFKRAETVGDIRSRMLGPKDTEMHQISSKEGSKTFKKYFLGSQYIQSQLQDTQGYETAIAQVLDEHLKQNDELFLTGGGTSNATVENNGLFYSGDSNYVAKVSYEVQKDGAGAHLADFYEKATDLFEEADEIDGEKIIMFYGDDVVKKHNGLFADTRVPFKNVLGDAVSASIAKIPKAVTPSGTNGMIIANLDQVKLHYTSLPEIQNQGQNDEKLYTWTNFLMGSSMLDVLAKGAVIHQPLTFEA